MDPWVGLWLCKQRSERTCARRARPGPGDAASAGQWRPAATRTDARRSGSIP